MADKARQILHYGRPNKQMQLTNPLPSLRSLRGFAADLQTVGRRWLQRCTMDPSDFERSVGESFAYLFDEFGYRRASVRVLGPEAWVTFEREPMQVRVHLEIGGSPWVTVELRSSEPSPTPAGRRWSLDAVLQEYGHKSDSGDTIEEQAQALRQFGSTVLRGDCDRMLERNERLWQAVLQSPYR